MGNTISARSSQRRLPQWLWPNASHAVSLFHEAPCVYCFITPGIAASAFEGQIASVCTVVPARKSTALTRRSVPHSSRWILKAHGRMQSIAAKAMNSGHPTSRSYWHGRRPNTLLQCSALHNGAMCWRQRISRQSRNFHKVAL